jgi:putative ABC transport system permease protein
MPDSAMPLTWGNIAVASLLLLLHAALSIRFRLHLAQPLLIAALRMIVQLSLLAFVLQWLFETESALATLFTVCVMLGFAAWETWRRIGRPLAGRMGYLVPGGAIAVAGLATLGYALLTQLSPTPWYAPRYAVPILGMILGSVMNAVALGIDNLTQNALRERVNIEAQLVLGRRFEEAMRTHVERAMRTALLPVLNLMAATGLVMIPGMMTGQILTGTSPHEAIKYQIMIILLIAGGTALAVFLAVMGTLRLLTDERERLRLDRLAGERK